MTGALLGSFLALMVTGIPVAIAMASAALIYIWASGSTPPMVVVHRMISGLDSFPLLAVPFFILAGNLMNNAGITNRIYNFALALVGWMKGGLGHVNIIGSVIFAGMSGTAIADAAGLGTIEIKAMRDHGYSKEFSVGVTAASATLGPIIPPSLPFVIYGMVANVSIGQLFLAGILPGLVMTVLMMLTVAYFAHKNNWGADIKFLWGRVGKATLELCIVIAFPLVIWAGVAAGGNPPFVTAVAMVILFAADWKWKFEAVLPIMTPVLLIGGMTTGHIHAYRGCRRRVDMGDSSSDCSGTARSLRRCWSRYPWRRSRPRRRCFSSSPPRRSSAGSSRQPRVTDMVDCVGAGIHAFAVGVPAAGQPAAAVRRLLPRADRRDHSSLVPVLHADGHATGHRPGAFRPRRWCST